MATAALKTICVLGSLKERGVFKMFRVPVGQSLEFDEHNATRAWLRPYLGEGDWHLIEFTTEDRLNQVSTFIADRL